MLPGAVRIERNGGCFVIDGLGRIEVDKDVGNVRIVKPYCGAVKSDFIGGFYIDDAQKPEVLCLRWENGSGQSEIRIGQIENLELARKWVEKLNGFYS